MIIIIRYQSKLMTIFKEREQIIKNLNANAEQNLEQWVGNG